MYEIKTKDVYKDFSNYKEMFDLTDCLAKSKYYCLCEAFKWALVKKSQILATGCGDKINF